MRLSFILLIAASTLAASSGAATNSNKFSTVASADAVQSMEATQLKRGGTRFLRMTKTEQEADNDDDDDDGGDDDSLNSEDEERAIPGLGKSISLPASLKNIKLPNSLLQSADKVMAAAKAPEINKTWLSLMEKVNLNPKARQFVGDLTTKKWTTDQLKTAMQITKNTPMDSDDMKAFSLLLLVRTWNNRPNIKSPQIDDAAVKFLQKVDDNPIAKKYATEFLENDWNVVQLMNTLGVTRKTPRNTKEMQAIGLLLKLRAQTNVQTKTGGVKTTLNWVPKSA